MSELFVSTILIKKYIIKYLLIEKVGSTKEENANNIINGYLATINLCEKYNIFPKLKNYYVINIIQNPIFKNTYSFKNEFFEKLEGEDTIDI